MPSALIIQHEPNGPAALVADRLEQRGYTLVPWFVSAPRGTGPNGDVPDPTGFDLVVALGSVHSVYDTDRVGAWIDRELGVLRAAHAGGVPLFGICFGAQALCVALGGEVEASPTYEAGWVEVDTDDESVVPSGPWFTWHGDRCLLPDGVEEVARNDVATQAFRLGRSSAVQFHPEVTEELVRGWMAELDSAWFARKGVDPDDMLGGFARHQRTAGANLTRMLDRFLDDTSS